MAHAESNEGNTSLHPEPMPAFLGILLVGMQFPRFLFLLLLLGPSFVPAAETTPQQEQFFETKIRPLLADQCWKCHGPTKQESDLRLDSPGAMARGGVSGEKLITPDPAQSL